MPEEKVVCFKRQLLENYHLYENIFFDRKVWDDIINNLEILPRSQAEKDFMYKQLIVYVLIKSQNHYLTYVRSLESNEESLKRRHSIGIGGHINITDIHQVSILDETEFTNFVLQAIWREVGEEITINSQIIGEPRLLCFINSDLDEIGRLHFGIVWVVEIRHKNVSKRNEKGIGKISFSEMLELKNNIDLFENWSKFLINENVGAL
jgi:predicted NUDIX family phosphoesterase